MVTRRLRTALLFGCGAALLGLAADAIPPTYIWQHPCLCPRGSLGDPPWHCEGGGEVPLQCWCVANWDDSDNWIDHLYGLPGVPDTSPETAEIILSNTGCCSSTNCSCSQQDNCLASCSGNCASFEDRLAIALTSSVSIHELRLITDDGNASSEKLNVRLETNVAVNYTVTSGSIVLDARNGPVTLEVLPYAAIQTSLAD
jgi:hypothetical protein